MRNPIITVYTVPSGKFTLLSSVGHYHFHLDIKTNFHLDVQDQQMFWTTRETTFKKLLIYSLK